MNCHPEARFWPKDLRDGDDMNALSRLFGPNLGFGRGAKPVGNQSEASREILRATEALQDDSFAQGRLNTS